jgi:transposase
VVNMGKPLSPDQRGAILYGHAHGDTSRTIANRLGCGKSTVNDIIKRFKETGTVVPNKSPGRPPILDSHDQFQLKDLVTNEEENNCRLSAVKIRNIWSVRTKKIVSTITIRWNLKKIGLRSCTPRPKPYISEVNREKRLNFALQHEHWKPWQWKRVLFSDESTFTLSQRSDRVWREVNEELKLSCISSSVKHSPSLMFWGCFAYVGLGPIIPLHGSVTGAIHAETIKKYVVPTLQKFFSRGGIFQEDNATPHKSKVATAVREAYRIKKLSWPPQSPDLNPIENLWHEMKDSIRRKSPAPSNLQELKKYVKRAWKDLPPEYYQRLIDSMPDRVSAVIAANGYHTKY